MTEKRVDSFLKLNKQFNVDFGFIVFRSIVIVENIFTAEIDRFLNGDENVNLETISKLISGKTSIFILGKVITPATIINNISILAATVLLTNQRIILSIIFSSKRLSAFHQLVRSILLIGFHLHYLDQRLSKLVPVHI